MGRKNAGRAMPAATDLIALPAVNVGATIGRPQQPLRQKSKIFDTSLYTGEALPAAAETGGQGRPPLQGTGAFVKYSIAYRCGFLQSPA